MNRHRTLTIAANSIAAVVLAASVVIATPALATPASGVTVTPISSAPFGLLDVKGTNGQWHLDVKSNHGSTIGVARVAIAAGGTSGWHSHPGVNFLAVISGTVVDYDGNNPLCTSKTIHAGETFIDQGDTSVHLVRNETNSPAEFIAVFMYNSGAAATRIDRPKPTNCPF